MSFACFLSCGEYSSSGNESLLNFREALSRGFEMGLKARCLIAQKLEDGWDRPLAEWRQALDLPA